MNADIAPLTPGELAATTSAPGRAPATGRSRSRRTPCCAPAAAPLARGLLGSLGGHGPRYTTRPPPRIRPGRLPSDMANIHSQVKRNLRTERERQENRHYSSSVKTHFRRLEAGRRGQGCRQGQGRSTASCPRGSTAPPAPACSTRHGRAQEEPRRAHPRRRLAPPPGDNPRPGLGWSVSPFRGSLRRWSRVEAPPPRRRGGRDRGLRPPPVRLCRDPERVRPAVRWRRSGARDPQLCSSGDDAACVEQGTRQGATRGTPDLTTRILARPAAGRLPDPRCLRRAPCIDVGGPSRGDLRAQPELRGRPRGAIAPGPGQQWVGFISSVTAMGTGTKAAGDRRRDDPDGRLSPCPPARRRSTTGRSPAPARRARTPRVPSTARRAPSFFGPTRSDDLLRRLAVHPRHGGERRRPRTARSPCGAVAGR